MKVPELHDEMEHRGVPRGQRGRMKAEFIAMLQRADAVGNGGNGALGEEEPVRKMGER